MPTIAPTAAMKTSRRPCATPRIARQASRTRNLRVVAQMCESTVHRLTSRAQCSPRCLPRSPPFARASFTAASITDLGESPDVCDGAEDGQSRLRMLEAPERVLELGPFMLFEPGHTREPTTFLSSPRPIPCRALDLAVNQDLLIASRAFYSEHNDREAPLKRSSHLFAAALVFVFAALLMAAGASAATARISITGSVIAEFQRIRQRSTSLRRVTSAGRTLTARSR